MAIKKHKQDNDFCDPQHSFFRNFEKHVGSGVIDDELLLSNQIILEDSLSLTPEFDAIYIITLGRNNNLIHQHALLKNHTKNLLVLTTKTTTMTEQIASAGGRVIELPKMEHSKLLRRKSSCNPSLDVNKKYDIPSKRNYALAESKRLGLKHVCFFDDDLILNESHLRRGKKALLNGFDIGSMYSLDFPDVSIIDLIESLFKKQRPKVTISGNALFLNVGSVCGFFPYVYNEDWLFFLQNMASGRSVVGISSVRQQRKTGDPLDRLRFEQFGEVIAYGVALIRGNGLFQLPCVESFWQKVFDDYLMQLDCLIKYGCNCKQSSLLLNAAINEVSKFSVRDLLDFSKNLNSELNDVIKN